jgi:hypothetical protein
LSLRTALMGLDAPQLERHPKRRKLNRRTGQPATLYSNSRERGFFYFHLRYPANVKALGTARRDLVKTVGVDKEKRTDET